MPEQRRSPRVRTRFDSLLSSGRREGVGLLADISYEGALLEESTLQPALGTNVRVYVFVQPVAPFELVGEVVRHTDRGFAIQFDKLSPELRSLVDDAAALVAVPGASEPRSPH